MFGLPDTIRACLFDLDGVLTQTAKVHAAAWKSMFDEYLHQRAQRTGEPFVASTTCATTTSTSTAARATRVCRSSCGRAAFDLPRGTPDDPPSAETIDGWATARTSSS